MSETEPTVRLRVRDGCRFGALNQYGPGDVVELPASVLVAFGDKLELVESEAAPAVPEPAHTKQRKGGKS